MKINTQQFGEIEYLDENLINFSAGVLGFENHKHYLLLKTDDGFFYWLNSVENPDICFPLVGVRILDEKYPQENDYEAFGIVTLNKDPLKVTINLKAPVYINQNQKNGFQKVIDDDKYPVNFNLFVE
jgi:flagellar assembly factor FliW